MSKLQSRVPRYASALLAVGALALTAACGGSSGSTKTDTKTVTGKTGGTLTYLSIGDFEHLDPARNYVTDAGDFGRLLFRTLTTYDAKPGIAGTKVVPDLATDLGTPSDNAKTWKFTLKSGIKFEDGTEVTSADVKYGVERTFSDLLPEGAPYIKDALVGGETYTGPYKDKKGLASIETPDKSTIIFHFKKPFADFYYAAALPTTAPVPAAKDTGVKYDDHPISSGPYMIQSYARGKSFVMVRNPNWDRTTDKARGAYPDKIEGALSLDGATIDQRLLADNGPDKFAITFKAIEPENVTRVTTEPALKARSVNGYDNSTVYTGMNTVKGVTKDIKVRQAIEIAWPKNAARIAAGGADAVGDFAHSVIPPSLASHKDFNLYDTGANDEGNPTKAKEMLAAAGHPDGISLSIGVVNSATGQKVAAVVKQGLAKAGITLNIQLIDSSKYYDTIGNPSLQPDLVSYAWIPDWPSASTIIPPLFTCAAIKPQGNNNVANYCNKDFDAKVDQAQAETDQTKADAIWAELDRKLIEDAVVIPRYFGKTISLQGSGVKNIYSSLPFAGQVDVSNVSVQ
jgi:peptide/nickel transport system substrate-binding protein